MPNARVAAHCREIDRCNQRGGRMLSVVDLIEAGTLTIDVAAYCLAAIRAGASFMVGALPGGAGKTTVMGALLNFVPPGVTLAPADSLPAIEGAMRRAQPRRCYICHEIGSGAYYAYLWGRELRAYFELPGAGHMLATNLHDDTCEAARAQVCLDNGVSAEAFARMNLLLFLSLHRAGGRIVRRISTVWESDGVCPHGCVYEAGGRSSLGDATALVPAERLACARGVIDLLVERGARTIEEVRGVIVDEMES